MLDVLRLHRSQMYSFLFLRPMQPSKSSPSSFSTINKCATANSKSNPSDPSVPLLFSLLTHRNHSFQMASSRHRPHELPQRRAPHRAPRHGLHRNPITQRAAQRRHHADRPASRRFRDVQAENPRGDAQATADRNAGKEPAGGGRAARAGQDAAGRGGGAATLQ